MPSPLLAKARRAGREIVSVTPERAGWHYVGFRALRLADGETESLDTGDQELCVVVLTGRVDVTVAAQTFAALGTRDSVFDPVAPAAVYVPLLIPGILKAIALIYLFGNQGWLKAWLFGGSIYGPAGVVAARR